jgi:hypothetical protein
VTKVDKPLTQVRWPQFAGHYACISKGDNLFIEPFDIGQVGPGQVGFKQVGIPQQGKPEVGIADTRC